MPCLPSEIAQPADLHRASRPGDSSKKRQASVQGQHVSPNQVQRSLTPPDSARSTRGDRQPNAHDAIFAGDPSAESSIVVSPVLTEDIRALDRYFSASTAEPGRSGAAEGIDQSLVYVKVPRRREGLAIAKNPGHMQKEILWQIIRPYAGKLLRSYFRVFHPAFPILDERAFSEIFKNGQGKISPALFCELFATTLTLWDYSGLHKDPKPDYQFIWNLAVEALNQDFLAPGLSTICSVLLDMTGRPIFSVIGNTVNNGRAIALGRSLGLNHDPRKWKRPGSEKSLRIRLWWAILIHDYWSSFSHGIPPNTTNRQHDVPIPDPADLTYDGQPKKISKAFECFTHLCTLSIILGEILPLVYDFRVNPDETWKEIQRLELELDNWQRHVSLPLHGPNEAYPTGVSGLSSLCFSYLSLRMLLCRLAFRVASRSQRLDNENYLVRLRQSAQDIADYFCSLRREQFHEFWLCYAAHILTFAFIILLRCTVEPSDESTVQSCKSSILNFWSKLQYAAESEGWDLANMCISRCGESMSKIMKIWDLQKNDAALPSIQLLQEDVMPNPTEQDRPLHDAEMPSLEEVMPSIPPFSDLDLWLENPSDAFWGDADMGMALNAFNTFDQPFGHG
ncbi:hypothetical protein N7492_004469 [Penicillium capsulatum]|uniref:Xylanolytic transcriptional activator regulatory domain-containing protein n=1 Tax=Penicillium capsulatum TaxID=69766 RepID=A0A9W9I7Y1_9EURO|nr:hypothetical protein N7492_004469 [Penicillium capsulatum]KAJ6136411.1 hypothetical protein N7512_001571 [Penicillium capsulatum]